MTGQVQILEARGPNPAERMERGCNVYHCDEPTAVVVSVGGGWERSTSATTMRLCRGHGEVLGRRIREVLA